MIIRRMIDEDLDIIDSLEKKIFSSPWPKKEYEYEIHENPYGNPYVVLEDNDIVAYFDYWIIFERAEIATIGVREDKRRLGYGQVMLNYIKDKAEKNGCENISLEVRVSNEKAIKLYEKNGFININIRKNYYDDNHEDAYLMVKPLGGNL
jgi:[ribosomal protein S18]-alanine N-acetyltransferase